MVVVPLSEALCRLIIRAGWGDVALRYGMRESKRLICLKDATWKKFKTVSLVYSFDDANVMTKYDVIWVPAALDV